MKQILKKFKLKHAARLFLILFALFVFCIPCSAAVVTTVSFTNDIGAPYGADGIMVYYNFLDELNSVLVNVGSSAELVFNTSYNPNLICHVVDGFLDYDYETIDVSDYLSDGVYQFFGAILTISDVSSTDVFCPEIPGALIHSVDEFLSYGIVYYDSIPGNIDVTLSYYSVSDYPYSISTMYLLLVPYSESIVVDNISNVWSNILLWITSAFNTVVGIFWTGTHLTLIGTLALVGTVVSLCLLIYYKVKDFLKLQ